MFSEKDRQEIIEQKKLIDEFLTEKEKALESEISLTEEDTNNKTESSNALDRAFNKMKTHFVQRLSSTFQKVADGLTASFVNRIKHGRREPYRQAQEFVAERAKAGKKTTEDVQEYIDRTMDKSGKVLSSIENANQTHNVFYNNFASRQLRSIAEYLYPDYRIDRIVDEQNTPDGYYGYKTGG
jgi:hypothetical protein